MFKYTHNALSISSLLMVLALMTQGCKQACDGVYTYVTYAPIYQSTSEIREGAAIEAAKEILRPGKIYRYGTYLLVSDRGTGVHIIDNSDASAPVHLSFVKVPGAMDMAVRGNLLYVDSYMDLVTISIFDPEAPKFIDRQNNMFTQWVIYNPDHERSTMIGYREGANIVVGYEEITITEEVDCNGSSMYRGPEFGFGMNDDASGFPEMGVSDVASGQAGSMSRFTLYGQYLYTIDNSELYTFDLGNDGIPNLVGRQYVIENIETTYPYQDKLFIGAQSGLFIFSLENPQAPTYLSEYNHWTACDPVVVQNDIAYVTLRSNESACAGWTNQLDIIDVSDILNPRLITSYDMTSPYGLGIDDETLFICEGSAGLKVFDTPDGIVISPSQHFKDLHAYDVIPDRNREILILIGEDGIKQYSYSNPKDLQLLSTLFAK